MKTQDRENRDTNERPSECGPNNNSSPQLPTDDMYVEGAIAINDNMKVDTQEYSSILLLTAAIVLNNMSVKER